MEFNGFCLGLLFDPAGANRLDRLAIQPNFCKQKEPGALPAVRAGRGYRILKAALVEWLNTGEMWG